MQWKSHWATDEKETTGHSSLTLRKFLRGHFAVFPLFQHFTTAWKTSRQTENAVHLDPQIPRPFTSKQTKRDKNDGQVLQASKSVVSRSKIWWQRKQKVYKIVAHLEDEKKSTAGATGNPRFASYHKPWRTRISQLTGLCICRINFPAESHELLFQAQILDNPQFLSANDTCQCQSSSWTVNLKGLARTHFEKGSTNNYFFPEACLVDRKNCH